MAQSVARLVHNQEVGSSSLSHAPKQLKPYGVKANRIKVMTNTQSYAKQELDILEATVPDAIILPFREEILALCEKFGESGQSGGSAPYTATAISKAIKSLLLQEPICDITGHKDEWVNISECMGGNKTWQNKRCGGLFKSEDGEVRYIDAIVWKGVEEYDTFCGRVYVDEKDFKLISSKQIIKGFPFKPKTFYIDVIRIPITKEEAERRDLHYIEDENGGCYYTILRDVKQLDSVYKYYKK